MKNKHILQMLIGGIIFVIGLVLAVIAFVQFSRGGQVVGGIFLIAALPFFAVGAIWFRIAESKSFKICDKCGGKMAGCSYEYQESGRYACEGTPGSYKLTVHIIATCPNCGTQKVINKTFTIGPTSNPQYVVDRFCRNHFGH